MSFPEMTFASESLIPIWLPPTPATPTVTTPARLPSAALPSARVPMRFRSRTFPEPVMRTPMSFPEITLSVRLLLLPPSSTPTLLKARAVPLASVPIRLFKMKVCGALIADRGGVVEEVIAGGEAAISDAHVLGAIHPHAGAAAADAASHHAGYRGVGESADADLDAGAEAADLEPAQDDARSGNDDARGAEGEQPRDDDRDHRVGAGRERSERIRAGARLGVAVDLQLFLDRDLRAQVDRVRPGERELDPIPSGQRVRLLDRRAKRAGAHLVLADPVREVCVVCVVVLRVHHEGDGEGG